jgi:hypothetical protein
MRLSRLIAGLVFVGAPLSVATSVHARGSDTERAEVQRIRAHFDSVLIELDARDVSRLSPNQQQRRARLVATLAAYRDRGVFPNNYDFPDRAMPYFVDRKTGRLCAVAHLLESTGRRDIVDRVARANNNVWVAELAGDSTLGVWLDRNGLTLAEAARIQVPYVAPVSPAEQARNGAFMVVGPLALATATVTTVWNSMSNADGHRRRVSWAGFASGALTATAGALVLTMNSGSDMARNIGVASIGLGGLSVFTSSRSIHRQREIAAERDAERRRSVADATLTPIIGLSGQSGSSVGASLSFKF